MDQREKNVEMFEDTKRRCETHEVFQRTMETAFPKGSVPED